MLEVMDYSPNSLPTSDHTVTLRHSGSPSDSRSVRNEEIKNMKQAVAL